MKAGEYITDGTTTWIIDDVRDGVQVGRIIYDIVLRDGYVLANGAEILRKEYPRLVNWAKKYSLLVPQATKNLGIAYSSFFGDGNGTTTITLPDVRGMFERAFDFDRGLDTDRGGGDWEIIKQMHSKTLQLTLLLL